MQSLLTYRAKRLKRSALARLALVSPGLSRLMATPAPLVKMEYPGDAESRRLVIFLPGIDDLAEDFERRGFIDDMRRHGITADAVAIDAHYGYYAERVIHDRITEDVIMTARMAGYEEIWLAGISLGGFGAVSYAARHASQVNGLFLFAPYLGGKELIREIAGAGGMTGWEPGDIAEGDYQRDVWKWLKDHFADEERSLPIYLGYGARDMFAGANNLLAQALPEEQVLQIPGGHDWRTWKTIWRMFLAGQHAPLR